MPYTNREGLRPIYAQSARENELLSEIEELESELRAFVAVALQHGMRDYCETRHPDLTREIEAGIQRSRERAETKYAKILAQILRVPGLHATRGETEERTYYRTAEDNVAYIEHALQKKRFILNGIWVAPAYRGKGIAHRILRRLVEAADETDFGIALDHEPFGEEGLSREDLVAFYNRHGFQTHAGKAEGMFRFPRTPLDLYARPHMV